MNRADIREIAASLAALADAADRVVASFGIEPHFSFGGALVAPQFNPTPAESGVPAGEDRDGGEQCRPAVAENLTDRQLRDQIVAASEKPINGSPWTEAEDVVLRDMLRANDGMSMNALAAKIIAQSGTGRTVDAIAYRLKNKTKQEIATTAGFRLGPLTDDERAEIMAATARGEDRPTIAGRLNRRVQAIALFLTAQTGPDGKAPGKVEAAPVVAPAAPAAPVDLPRWQVTLRTSLNALGYSKGWDAEADYDMMVGLARGGKTAEVALDLGKDTAAMLDRWKAIKALASDEDGRFGTTEQERLLIELQARAMASRQVAA